MRRPPDLFPLAVAAAGALGLAVGVVAVLNGHGAGLAVAFGGLLLLAWSVRKHR